MRSARVTVSRRTILLAAPSAMVVAGCRDHRPVKPDPDAAAVAAARDTEQRLAAAYDAAGDARRRDEHLAHLQALGGVMPTAPPSASDPATLTRTSAPLLQSAAIEAYAGPVAAVLASIAAAHLAAR